MRPKSRLILVAFACVIFTNTTSVQAEDLKRWRFVLPSGEFLTENGTIQVVEGLPSVYSNRVIYYDPYGKTPNRCAAGCTFALDTYQNEEGTTTTTAVVTTTSSSTSSTTTVAGGSNSGTTTTSVQSSTSTSTSTSTTTTAAPSSAGPFTGWTLRIAQLSQNQMQINGCLNNTGSTTPLTVTASWTVSKDGVSVGSGSGTSSGLLLSSSSNPVCPTEFLANVSGLTASTEYVVTYSGGIAGNIVSGSRTIVTSNAPPTTTTTTTTTVAPTTTTVAPTTTATATTSTTRPSSITIEPATTSSSAPKSDNTSTTEVGSSNSFSESPSSSSSVSSAETTTTTAVPNGEVRAFVGGVEVKSETTVADGAVTVSVGAVTAEIADGEASDNSQNTQVEQGLVLSSGESADVSVDGLQPNSEVEVVIYSTPRNLGSLQVNEFGELVASIQIPSDMESGPHTLVLSGLDQFGKQIELKFGLVVYSPDSYIPIWVWFLVGLLLFLLAASLVSQKNKKVIIAT